jgi:hypothetical protein
VEIRVSRLRPVTAFCPVIGVSAAWLVAFSTAGQHVVRPVLDDGDARQLGEHAYAVRVELNRADNAKPSAVIGSSTRRTLTTYELTDINLAASTSGNGPIVDALILRTAARRGGALGVLLEDLDA